MKKIGDGIYEHEGLIFVAMRNNGNSLTDCIQCHFGSEPCPITACRSLLGKRKYFKLYEEPKVEKIKLADVSFKCAVLTAERSEILQKAVFAAGGRWQDSGKKRRDIGGGFIFVDSGIISYSASTFTFTHNSNAELTLQQALDLLATVEKPESVFDIKPFDRILARRKRPGVWNCDFHNTVDDDTFYVIGYHNQNMKQIVKYEGNEALLGTTDTPSGWWEARDGKPVWVTK